jgi:dimethylhistidine N-methyltransferase
LLAAARAIWRRLDYYPVDVSWSALDCARTSIERSLPGIHVYPIVNDYMQTVGFLRHTSAPRMVLYIGSSIGNLEHEDAAGLLRRLRERLTPGDSLLLGADLVKCPDTLVAAYDDQQGVTAAFNKNVLSRINGELGGHFDLDLFRHVALWNEKASRMEMHLESTQAQLVPIDLLRVSIHFEEGERIHTENSYKYTPESVCGLLSSNGFIPEKTWYDDRRYFAVHLARV